ncbi:hypothetical protein PROFUN_03305 [Planoprotostelium fungivorum]|uniref:Uncharacterized protein n=1 Tax=Planoprotostelium fungivorum TaxID=1890364 RepID=A0A2P6NWR0_9EUKA|nr:hypothetical protein PROFUN_03305 [Planoprotostelium fungivorum]
MCSIHPPDLDLLSLLNRTPLKQGPFTKVHVFTEHSSFSTNFPGKYNVSGNSLSFTSLEDVLLVHSAVFSVFVLPVMEQISIYQLFKLRDNVKIRPTDIELRKG